MKRSQRERLEKFCNREDPKNLRRREYHEWNSWEGNPALKVEDWGIEM